VDLAKCIADLKRGKHDYYSNNQSHVSLPVVFRLAIDGAMPEHIEAYGNEVKARAESLSSQQTTEKVSI